MKMHLMAMTLVLLAIISGSCEALRPLDERPKVGINLANGLGLTPPMGWNSWNHFGYNINENIIKETADALVSSGLANLGYKYVNIDDGWAELNRSKEGFLVPHKKNFPSGIKALADYVHSKGLKLGIYADAGYFTCSERMPGSLDHEDVDALTFAEWGVDYLKYDNCFNGNIKPTIRYPRMTQALTKAHAKTHHEIFFSMCEWGDMHPSKWGFKVANMWRTTNDIGDNWLSMVTKIDENNVFAGDERPGGWNDPDMLEVGNGGMKHNEYIVHFSLWAMSKAPLLIGCDIRKATKETMDILSNQEVIAINQDPLGIQASKKRQMGESEVWAGPLSDYRVVVLLLNRRSYGGPQRIVAFFEDIGLHPNTFAKARDVWNHKNMTKTYYNKISATLEQHSCRMFILTPVSK